jgi:hypothetical protein
MENQNVAGSDPAEKNSDVAGNAEKTQAGNSQETIAKLERALKAVHRRLDEMATPAAPKEAVVNEAENPLAEKIRKLEADNRVLQKERELERSKARKQHIKDAAIKAGADPEKLEYLMDHIEQRHAKKIKVDYEADTAYYNEDPEDPDSDVKQLDEFMTDFIGSKAGSFFKRPVALPRGNLRSNSSHPVQQVDSSKAVPMANKTVRASPADILKGKVHLQ